jgi:S1-C subfamily serine protease
MPSLSDWKVPASAQPKPEDYGYDLERAFNAVVGLRAIIPGDAYTAETLGTERAGNGVLIRGNGLVLTIGYLITEAETIWLSLNDGRSVPGHVLGYDQETGFGLVQALAKLDMPALDIGQSAATAIGERVVVAGAGGRQRSVAARIVAKQEFAGYWEYVLDEAIFTAPAHPNWGGTALIGPAGDLIGVGSLQLQHAVEKGQAQNINMIVPIDLLNPILDDLMKFGRRNAPPRRHRALGCRQGSARPGKLLPPRLGARRSRRRRAGLDLPRRRHHGRARQVERAQSVPQWAEFALTEFMFSAHRTTPVTLPDKSDSAS